MPLNSCCPIFIMLQSRLPLHIRTPRQSTGSVPQTKKKYFNLSFQASDCAWSRCCFSYVSLCARLCAGGFCRLWGAKSDQFTDSWPRERKAVFNSLHSREANGKTPNDKNEEAKTTTGLQGGKTNRYDRESCVNGRNDLSGCRTYCVFQRR